jgi:hypothetical protein
VTLSQEDGMIIDCDTCVMDGTAACADCVVTVLLGTGDGPVALIDEEAAAISNLAEAGLVSPLRLVTRGDDGDRARRTG